jgi:hypothetical protein
MVMQPQKSKPPVGDVVEAWVLTGWFWVFWDGETWRYYPTWAPVEAAILRWRYVPMGA